MSIAGEPTESTVSFDTTMKPPDGERDGERSEDSLSQEAGWVRLMGSQAQRYRFVRKLGAGGMGVVYLAHDTKLERKVAIKALRGAASDKLYRRLLREAQALAKLSHPNVVHVFDVDVIEDELRVSMQYVEGQTLRAWLNAEPRSLQAILEVFVAAGEGLAAAHKANLTHRDFKPDNVLIDVEGEVRVADFGLARASDERDGETAPSGFPADASHHDLTQTGAFVGTPLYMAPELFDEAEKKGSALSDQYAFCVSLYEALYGEPPFWGSNLWNLVAAVTEGEIKKPDPGNARVAKIPRSVERAIRRGMAREPGERFASMAELNRALSRAAKRAGRRSRRLVLASLGVASLLAGGGYLGARHLEARAYERECVSPARALYMTGTRQGLVTARERMERCEVGFDRHSDAAVELLRVDNALLYGAGDQAPPRIMPPGVLAGADTLVASVGAELWTIGTEAPALALADYPKLWARAAGEARGWLDTLALAADEDPRFVVAPGNPLWLTALLVRLAPDSGVDLDDLRRRIDGAIEATRDESSGRPQFLLVRFRAELEPDHRRAAALLADHLAEPWVTQEASKELVDLLRAEQGYRLALLAFTRDDDEARGEATAAVRPDGQPLQIGSPRLDLARVALALRNGDDPATLRGDLDRALASASSIWWDPRFIAALQAVEAEVIAVEAAAAREQAKSEELVEQARESLAALQRPLDPDPPEPEPEPKPKPKSPKVGKVDVTFNKGDHTTAVFEVSGLGGAFQAAPNVDKSVPAKRLRVRCQALHSSSWTEWATITPRGGATIRCTRQGVKIDR